MRHCLVLLLFALVCFHQTFGAKADSHELGEALGFYLWEDYKHLKPVGMTPEDLVRGIQKCESGEQCRVERSAIYKFCSELCREYEASLRQSNLKEAEESLRVLASHEGVEILENGKLVVQRLEEGTGDVIGDEGLFHFKARFNGEEVLETESNNAPARQELKLAILGFEKGVRGMREGEKRRLYIHPDLGYGTSDPLHPNELLVLEAKLIDCLKNPGSSPPSDSHSENQEISLQDTGSSDAIERQPGN